MWGDPCNPLIRENPRFRHGGVERQGTHGWFEDCELITENLLYLRTSRALSLRGLGMDGLATDDLSEIARLPSPLLYLWASTGASPLQRGLGGAD